MALTYSTLTLDTFAPDGVTRINGTWRLRINTVGEILKNTDGGAVLAGRQRFTTTNGRAVFSLPDIPQTGIVPADASYRLTFESRDKTVKLSSEDFQVSGPMTLDDIMSASGVPLTSSLVAQAETARDEAAAAAAAAAAVGNTNDTIIASRVNDPASATRGALDGTYSRPSDLGLYVSPGITRPALNIYPTLAAALAAASAGSVITLSADTHTLSASAVVALDYVTIRGAGKQATTLSVTADVVALDITGDYVSIEDLRVDCTTTGRTVYPVKFNAANHGAVRRCYFNGNSGGSRLSGVYFTGGSMGAVDDCTFNHSCIRVETWDVKITRCYVWAMTCDFGVGIFNGVGNTTLDNVDVVPPLESTATGIAGILVDGASGNPFNTKMSNIYLDGNASLVTRQGIYIGDGAGATLMQNVNANQMSADCIVIDSAYNVLLNGYSGHTNNKSGTGAREIVIKQTGGQPIERVRLANIHCLRTSAVTGTAGPAIEVDAAVAGRVSIIDFDIKQPSGGGGYSNPEVKVPSIANASMSGQGQLSRYYAEGSQAVASGATGATINLSSGVNMAYRPLVSDITLNFEGAMGRDYRIQFNSDNQIFVPFDTALGAAGTIHWRVSLRRW